MEPVFIVAQYKSGTSWLLSALSAHPAVRGLREIDIVRAAYEVEGDVAAPAGLDHRLPHFFGKSAWCNEQALGYDVVAALAAGEHPEPEKAQPGRPQGFADLHRETALDLYATIRDAADPEESLDAFVAATAAGAPDGVTHLVLKAADQIAVLDQLQAWQPDAKKVIITRDGRDAAISASHYKQLMQDAPWFSGNADYWRLLENWASRAVMIADAGRSGDAWVMRYEDLSADFAGTLGPLLSWLGVDADPDRVAAINDRTSFEARTGRKRGSEGTGVIRKGMVGEWVETLSVDDQDRAWELTGDALAGLGYTRSGEAAPLPDAVAPSI
jgi:hypothetical protein